MPEKCNSNVNDNPAWIGCCNTAPPCTVCIADVSRAFAPALSPASGVPRRARVLHCCSGCSAALLPSPNNHSNNQQWPHARGRACCTCDHFIPAFASSPSGRERARPRSPLLRLVAAESSAAFMRSWRAWRCVSRGRRPWCRGLAAAPGQSRRPPTSRLSASSAPRS